MDILHFEKHKKYTYTKDMWPKGMAPFNIDFNHFQWRWSLFVNSEVLKGFFICYDEDYAYIFSHINGGIWAHLDSRTLSEAKYNLIQAYYIKKLTPRDEYYCPF